MRTIKLIAACTCLIAANAFAMDESEQIIFKFRANYSAINGKLRDLPQARSTSPQSPGSLFSSAYGLEGSATLFITDNFAGEFATGLTIYKAKSTAIAAIANNYSSTAQLTKKKNMYLIPSYATLQYHIAPYGAIRPYVGAGYQYSYIIPKAKQYKVKNASGPVFQAGVDVVLKDDTYINFDAKYSLLTTKVRFNQAFVTDANRNQINSKMKLNPFTAAIGLGFKL